jgi:hypothetical protein
MAQADIDFWFTAEAPTPSQRQPPAGTGPRSRRHGARRVYLCATSSTRPGSCRSGRLEEAGLHGARHRTPGRELHGSPCAARFPTPADHELCQSGRDRRHAHGVGVDYVSAPTGVGSARRTEGASRTCRPASPRWDRQRRRSRRSRGRTRQAAALAAETEAARQAGPVRLALLHGRRRDLLGRRSPGGRPHLGEEGQPGAQRGLNGVARLTERREATA